MPRILGPFFRAGGALVLLLLSACSNSSNGGAPAPGGNGAECGDRAAYDGTFAAIQQVVFERHGCTQQVCHGSSAQGGLDLSPDVAYENVFDVASTASRLKRVEPGDKDRSFLWLKLAAKTRPEVVPTGVEIAGAPMPNGLPAIGEAELEAMRLWIYAGAPRTGTVPGTENLLDACLPDARPITIKPLDPPAPGEGVQFVMPTVPLPASTEQELCFATYYDFSAQVPMENRDPTGRYFRFSAQELRQDPQSHHLTMNYAGVDLADIHHPSFGAWTCAGGDREGQACEPTDLGSCGGGLCRSEPRNSVGCVGYGPQSAGSVFVFQRIIGGAQQTQAYQRFDDGVFAQIPIRGILYWNSHAFNLSPEPHRLNGRINFLLARDQRYPVNPILNVNNVFKANAAPYTTQTVCADHVLPQGSRVFILTSHTHKRGKRFWVTGPDGALLFENFVYNDPVKQRFDPPLEFDSPDPVARTLTYCAKYDNGVAEDGSPDPETVTRASRVPQSAQLTFGRCNPVACAAGRIGAACNGVDDDATCDTSPGAGDGDCDACRITGGESTENEMFILIGSTYIADGFPQPDSDDPIFAGPASVADARERRDPLGRSTYTGFAVPPDLGCGTSAGAHAAHAAGAGHAADAAHEGHGG